MRKIVLILFSSLLFSANSQAVDLSGAYGEKTMEEKLEAYKKINEKLEAGEKDSAPKLKVYEEEEEEHSTISGASEATSLEAKKGEISESVSNAVISPIAENGSETETEEGTVSKYWNKFKSNTSKTWENPTNYNVMIPFYAWHNRLAYDKSHLDKYNEEAWGLGFAMSRYDADDDWHTLYAMVFKDSNSYAETMFGYAYQDRHYFDSCHKWFAGAGFTLGLTQRHEYSYIPVPLPLPMFSFGHRNFNINMAYVPGIKNDGNVAFFFTNIEF